MWIPCHEAHAVRLPVFSPPRRNRGRVYTRVRWRCAQLPRGWDPRLAKDRDAFSTPRDILEARSRSTLEFAPGQPREPDFLVINLNPDRQTFDEVMEVARTPTTSWRRSGDEVFIKTSGATGVWGTEAVPQTPP